MITSSQNPKLQRLRRLIENRATRQAEGCFAVEGVRLCEEGYRAGWGIDLALYSPELSPRGRELVEQMRGAGDAVEEVEERLLRQATDTRTPQGLAVVFRAHALPLPAQPDFLILADNLRDPGNLGTLLRAASAAGAQGALLSAGCSDPWSPKVLRAAMGAHFRLPIRCFGWDELGALIGNMTLYAAEASPAAPTCWDADFLKPLILAVGSEAQGFSQELLARTHQSVRIPMPGGAESLNAAIAAGILLFEVVRQRWQKPG